MELLAPWLEGPFTLKEASERYGEALVAEALRERVLKPVMTRLGPVLVPGGRGRVLLGLTRYYTPRPGPLEVALLVRRQAEAMAREGYRVLRRQGARAILEGRGERVLLVGSRGPLGRRPKPQDDLEASATRVVVLVPEGTVKRSRIEVKEVGVGSG
ncbi:hypothetical protein [Thermus sp.]|uniref:hypothetical protein n=1 Tax=Thermus sp. TaxID=275 RepID=UPI003D0E82B1